MPGLCWHCWHLGGWGYSSASSLLLLLEGSPWWAGHLLPEPPDLCWACHGGPLCVAVGPAALGIHGTAGSLCASWGCWRFALEDSRRPSSTQLLVCLKPAKWSASLSQVFPTRQLCLSSLVLYTQLIPPQPSPLPDWAALAWLWFPKVPASALRRVRPPLCPMLLLCEDRCES